LPNEIDQVKVLNVLQGNWNELKYNEQVKIVYDIGGCLYSSMNNNVQRWKQCGENSTKPLVFVVPHHGTEVYPSNVQLTLNKNSNSVAIISVGKNNYGHPSNNTIKYLSPYFGNIKKTDNDGDVEERL